MAGQILRAIGLVIVAAVVGSEHTSHAAQTQTPRPLPTQPTGSSQLDDVVERQDPFAFAGQTFTIVKHYKRLPAEVPVRVDWLQRRLVLAQQCFYQSGQGLKEEGCEVPAPQVERAPVDQDLTVVRLFNESRESSGAPAHVVVKKDSTVEVLAGKVLVKWEDLPDAVSLGVDDDIWLKVRIDGKEGWIHTQEDLRALGLQASGGQASCG